MHGNDINQHINDLISKAVRNSVWYSVSDSALDALDTEIKEYKKL